MKTPRYLFPVFLLITIISYAPAYQAGFVFDFLGWQRVYDQGSFLDFLNCFGYPGNHQTLHFFFYSFYALFHIQSIAWFLLFCGLHAFNGWLLWNFLRKINERWSIDASPLMLVLISVLFLLHPYQVEPVVWKVCMHYLLSLTCILGMLHTLMRASVHHERKWYVMAFGLFGLSLFLLELSYVTPLVVTLFLVIDQIVLKQQKAWRPIIITSAGMWLMLLFALLINRWTLGAWVGHYGADTHLRLDIMGMMSTELKYLVKHIADARYFSFKTKNFIFDNILSTPEVVFFAMTALMALLAWYIVRLKSHKGFVHLMYFGLIASLIYVLPIANLYFFHLHVGTNDRFSYVPLTFLLVFFTAALAKTPRWIWIPLTCMGILINVYFQEKTIGYWKESTRTLHALRDSFRWHDKSHVFILNSPDNLNGIVMASIHELPSGIEELIDFQTDKPYDGLMFDVFQYNMTTPEDGVTVEQTGPMQLKVTFKQWGNWWHRNGIGATSYENEYYKAEVLDYPYQITFKQLPENSVILYQDGPQWKSFELQ
jgi:hypothetical protein